jgi:hypothetical protein
MACIAGNRDLKLAMDRGLQTSVKMASCTRKRVSYINSPILTHLKIKYGYCSYN